MECDPPPPTTLLACQTPCKSLASLLRRYILQRQPVQADLDDLSSSITQCVKSTWLPAVCNGTKLAARIPAVVGVQVATGGETTRFVVTGSLLHGQLQTATIGTSGLLHGGAVVRHHCRHAARTHAVADPTSSLDLAHCAACCEWPTACRSRCLQNWSGTTSIKRQRVQQDGTSRRCGAASPLLPATWNIPRPSFTNRAAI